MNVLFLFLKNLCQHLDGTHEDEMQTLPESIKGQDFEHSKDIKEQQKDGKDCEETAQGESGMKKCFFYVGI